MDKKNKYPKSRLGWLWENMEGRHALFIVALFGTALYNVLQLVVPHFSRELINLFSEAQRTGQPQSDKEETIYTLLTLMVGLTLFRVIVVYLDCMAYERVSQGTLFRIRNFLYNKIQRQDMKFYSTYRTGDLMTRVTGDLDAVRHNIAWVIRCIVESITLFCSAAVYFFLIDVVLALCIVSIAPLIFFIVFRFRKKVGPMHKALREKLAGMNTDAQENISGNRVVKAFAREEYEKEKFDKSNMDYRDTNIKTQMVWLKFFPFVELIANALPVILLMVGGVFIINGRISMGDYTAFSLLIWAIANPMRMMGNIMNEFQRFSAASDKIMEIFDSEAEIVDHPDAIAHSERFVCKVEFDHVSFQYE
ncbi:MAG: ABC transporter ATP-binding protein, partial [Lachnospiraceae bacterium]|nr:ABC transporter ATP-binding protein [Lachnospiraceae bacterium]